MITEIKKAEYKLTQYSHGAGCGCKISPKVLDSILKSSEVSTHFPELLVGNNERDDAAVFDLGDGSAIVSTTDFFMPIVDDPVDFGRIASVNAISDVYAMGGTPLVAIAILGWPINEIPAEVANKVIEGARIACAEAGIPLAGGHSIDSPEPIFGLAVTGRVIVDHLKKNGTASTTCKLFLTKPLGVGILSTAQKKGKLRTVDKNLARDNMVILNRVGAMFAKQDYVKAMTDVTGFGLLGHLTEMCEASNLTAIIDFEKIPLINKDIIDYYIAEKCIPGGTNRNWESYGHKIGNITEYQRVILCDPQTSGGLLIAVESNNEEDFKQLAFENKLQLEPLGFFEKKANLSVKVI